MPVHEPEMLSLRQSVSRIDLCPPTSSRGRSFTGLTVASSATPTAIPIAQPSSGRDWMFPAVWLFISFASAVDTYLTIRFQESLDQYEQNPMARLLLSVHNWEPSLLISAKFLGSTVVLGILSTIYARNRRRGFVVGGAVALFQLGLLGYLCLG